jgi:hypothetical protein
VEQTGQPGENNRPIAGNWLALSYNVVNCIYLFDPLSLNIQFWIDIGVHDFIIDTIRYGYKIPFYSSPPSVYLSSNSSALKNANVDTAIQDLLNS